MTALTFHNKPLELIRLDGQDWIKGLSICQCLGYSDVSSALSRIYERNQDEFTDSMTRIIKIGTNGGAQMVRVFTLRGAHLLAMFARTPVAKEFRRWVLDILETASKPKQLALPEPQKPVLDADTLSRFLDKVELAAGGALAMEANRNGDMQFYAIQLVQRALTDVLAESQRMARAHCGRTYHSVWKLGQRQQ